MPHTDLATVLATYKMQVSAGLIESDPAQILLARKLDVVLGEVSNRRLASKSSALGWLFARRGAPKAAPRGLYIHGAVGRGKTMLMDMFFQKVPAKRKRRAHFNDFMADVHERIHAHRQKLARGETREADPVPPVASQLFSEAWVLCFDEFAVTDIADAMLLSRLFEQLFQRGCVLIATSNVMPENLYREGLNRDLFKPFIKLLEANVDVLDLDSRTDYRLAKTSLMPVYHVLAPGEDNHVLDLAWAEATAGKSVAADTVPVKGRQVPVKRAGAGAARFNFSDLCDTPLGAGDYMAISSRYHTIFVDRVPQLDRSRRNAAKRFIALVDVLYDRKNRLFVSAETPAAEIYRNDGQTEGFEFARTASRLAEMQTADYIAASRAAVAKTGEASP